VINYISKTYRACKQKQFSLVNVIAINGKIKHIRTIDQYDLLYICIEINFENVYLHSNSLI
jgi:hypothetical protein